MRRIKSIYYDVIVSIFEKYGYEVVTSLDRKNIYISKNPELNETIPFREIEDIFIKENLSQLIDDIYPVQVSTWRVTVI